MKEIEQKRYTNWTDYVHKIDIEMDLIEQNGRNCTTKWGELDKMDKNR